MIGKHLDGWEGVALSGLDYLFIENVGNLVCPSSYDLGEKIRVALLSVTEGEDKPLKYPTMFNSADAAVITKIDISEPCGFDRDLALRNINEIRPGIRIFETSAKTGAGMEEWLGIWRRRRRFWAENVAHLGAQRPSKTTLTFKNENFPLTTLHFAKYIENVATVAVATPAAEDLGRPPCTLSHASTWSRPKNSIRRQPGRFGPGTESQARAVAKFR